MTTPSTQTLTDLLAMRQNAERILESLLRARAECDQCLQKERRADPMRSVTGASSLDKAVADTRRMIDTLNRAVEEAAREAGGRVPPAVEVTVARPPAQVQ
jgi:hypothetical protein